MSAVPALPSAHWSRVGAAVRVLAAPLAYASTVAWLEAAGAAVREAVGAPEVTVFGADDRHRPASTSYPPWVAAALAEYADVLERAGCVERAFRTGVATRRDVFGPAYAALADTPYVREFLPTVGATDSLTVAAGAEGAGVRVVLNATEPDRPFTPDDVAVARLLRPALEAGVTTEGALGPARADLHALVDRAAPCAVYDADGRRLHLSAALDARLEREPHREALLEAVDRCGRRGPGAATVEGAGGAYRLAVSQAVLDGRPARVVVVGMPARAAGLTARQAEVAALLARRRSNREVAEALGISPHTARHHTEAVLRVLGVTDRRDVAAALDRRA